MNLRPLRARYVVLLVLVAALTVCTVFMLSPSNRVVIISSNTNFKISATCTFGTNHVYFYGNALELDPAIKRWTDTNAYRLRYASTQAGTVIWVRLVQRDDVKPSPVATTNSLIRMPEGGYSRLRARLISSAGTESVLAADGRLKHYNPTRTGGCYVEGWLLVGSPEDHRGSVLKIDSPDGMAIATLHVR
jgi:hypothetical protein